jgi:glucose/arabinose dehydrogenase
MSVRRGLVAALAAVLATALAPSGAFAAAKTHLVLRKLATFKEPAFVTQPPKASPNGRLFVVVRAGRIWIVRNGKVDKQPFLDIRSQVMTTFQRGLFSMAFAPDYATSGHFYIEYVHGPDDTVQLDEFTRSASDPNRADPASQRHVLNVGHAGNFHHGGTVMFGPDGYLYVSTGVDDNGALAQRLDDLHGKILRIDPRASGGQPYTVPPDNPFVGRSDAAPEVWAYGLRNPWRFSFDRLTGDMAIGDVGEHSYEEVDFIPHGTPAGENFGYPIYEGNWHAVSEQPTPDDYVPPVLTYRHDARCAVMGGYVVRDPSLSGLYGRYLFADMCTQPLRTAILQRPKATQVGELPDVRQSGMMSFGQDNAGHLYVMTLDGNLFRIKAVPTRKHFTPRGGRTRSTG